jgi:hypothetical protein
MAKKFLTAIDLNTNELQNAKIQPLATAPTAVTARIYYDSTLNKLGYYNGTTWVYGDTLTFPNNGAITWSRSGDAVTLSIANATSVLNGLMPATDKAKLDAATASNTNSTIVMRDASGNFAANVITANRVTGLSAPSSGSDAATKDYVDAARSGLDVKDSVRAATTANITLTGAQTIDGVSVVAGNRVLVKDQTTGSQNGIYICAAGAWTRSTDMPAASTAAGNFVFVEEGTTNDNRGFVCTNNAGSDVVGTASLTFSVFSNTGSINTNSTIVNSSGTYGVANYTVVSGSTVARVVTFGATNIGSGSGVVFTHNLSSQAVLCVVRDATTREELEVDQVATNTNALTITALGATTSVLVTVIG